MVLADPALEALVILFFISGNTYSLHFSLELSYGMMGCATFDRVVYDIRDNGRHLRASKVINRWTHPRNDGTISPCSKSGNESEALVDVFRSTDINPTIVFRLLKDCSDSIAGRQVDLLCRGQLADAFGGPTDLNAKVELFVRSAP